MINMANMDNEINDWFKNNKNSEKKTGDEKEINDTIEDIFPDHKIEPTNIITRKAIPEIDNWDSASILSKNEDLDYIMPVNKNKTKKRKMSVSALITTIIGLIGTACSFVIASMDADNGIYAYTRITAYKPYQTMIGILLVFSLLMFFIGLFVVLMRKIDWWLILTNYMLVFVILFCCGWLAYIGMVQGRVFSDIDSKEDPDNDFKDIIISDHPDVVYFLVAGLDPDTDANKPYENSRTDILMVVCYDIKNKKANVMQIPRDTYVGGIPSEKVNAVYRFPRQGESRINALKRKINSDFGLPVDHYIVSDIAAFKNIVDAVGTIDITLPKAITFYDEAAKKSKTIGPGLVKMDGFTAVGFVRHRKSYNEGDEGRMKAQQLFYAAFIKKLMSLSKGEMMRVANSCNEQLFTDMDVGLMLGYADSTKGMEIDDIVMHIVPGFAKTASPAGNKPLSYYFVYKNEYVDMLNEYFRPYEQNPITASELTIPKLYQ